MITKNVAVKNQKSSDLDPALDELVAEAQGLFEVLDTTSENIRKLESRLSQLKANFPFRYLIEKGEAYGWKEPEKEHLEVFPQASNLYTVRYKYLAWEAEEKTNKFRFFLIIEEEDNICNGFSDQKYRTECNCKKPLIETDLNTRLEYAKHLADFISSFTSLLAKHRISIEAGNGILPF